MVFPLSLVVSSLILLFMIYCFVVDDLWNWCQQNIFTILIIAIKNVYNFFFDCQENNDQQILNFNEMLMLILTFNFKVLLIKRMQHVNNFKIKRHKIYWLLYRLWNQRKVHNINKRNIHILLHYSKEEFVYR